MEDNTTTLLVNSPPITINQLPTQPKRQFENHYQKDARIREELKVEEVKDSQTRKSRPAKKISKRSKDILKVQTENEVVKHTTSILRGAEIKDSILIRK